LLFPIDGEVVDVIAGIRCGLPMSILAGWANRINLVVPLALHQQLRINISRIYDMLVREQFFAGEPGVNSCGHGIISDRSGCGFHMRHDQGEMSFTGFGQMHFISLPLGTAFLGVVGLFIIGGTDVTTGSRGKILRRSPANDIIDTLIIVHPHLAQDVHCRNLLEPLRCAGIKKT